MGSNAAGDVAQGDYEAFEKLVSSQNPGKLPDLSTFQKFILSKPEGPGNLAKLESLTAPSTVAVPDPGPAKPVTLGGTPEVPGYSQQCAANGSFLNLWFYQRATVDASSIQRECVANMGGITPGFPGGATL